MNPSATFLVASIGLVGIWLSWAIAPVAGVPLLILAMLIGASGASKVGDRRQPAAAFSRRRNITHR